MSTRLSPALTDFAEGRWPDERSYDRHAYDRHALDPHALDRQTLDQHTLDQHTLDRLPMEPPPHPSEHDRYDDGSEFENGHRWSARRRVAAGLARFLIVFGIGITATLIWQSYSGAARRLVAGLSPQLGWLTPPPAQSPAGAPPDQLAAISHSLSVVRQSVDKLAADITRLQTAKQDAPPARTAGATAAAPAPAAAAPGRKPTPGPTVTPGPMTAR